MTQNEQDLPLELTDDEQDDTLKSKSQIKDELRDITRFGMELAEFSMANLKKLPLNEKILEAFSDLDRMKGNEAKKRHFKRIGKLLREIDLEPVKLAYTRYKAGQPLVDTNQSPSFAEQWYTKLIEQQQDPETFVQQYDYCDRQQLRQLIRNALKAPTKHKEKLIQYLETFE